LSDRILIAKTGVPLFSFQLIGTQKRNRPVWRRFLRFTRVTGLALQRGVRRAALAKIVQASIP
jgi:hypothetical protein